MSAAEYFFDIYLRHYRDFCTTCSLSVTKILIIYQKRNYLIPYHHRNIRSCQYERRFQRLISIPVWDVNVKLGLVHGSLLEIQGYSSWSKRISKSAAGKTLMKPVNCCADLCCICGASKLSCTNQLSKEFHRNIPTFCCNADSLAVHCTLYNRPSFNLC